MMPRPVIVISSVNQDTSLTVPHFPQPGETLHSTSASTSLGGKGANVAIAAAHATKSVYLVGAVGSDSAQIVPTLTSHQVDTTYLRQVETDTGRAVVMVNPRGQNCIVVSTGANAHVSSDLPSELQAMMPGSLVVLQLEIEHRVTQELAVKADGLGATVVFNPSPAPTESSAVFGSYAKIWKAAHIVVLNEVEVEQISGIGRRPRPTSMVDEWADSIAAFLKRCREDVTVILTLGKAGVIYYRDRMFKHVKAVEVNDVVDTTGAGDVFTGFVVGGLAEGKKFEESLDIARRAAAVCVTRHGAADSIPTMNEITESADC